MSRTAPLAAVLLDLDGTLLDTAPDICEALNRLRVEHGAGPLPLERVRRLVSHGSSAVVRAGFPEAAGEQFERLRARFLQLYREHLAVATRLFPGFEAVLDRFDAHRLPWGVVTNKPAFLSEPLLEQLGLAARMGCLLSGDSLPARKPDPLPLLTAAARLRVEPARCLYLGDSLRDAQAAQAAHMVALGADFGYLDPQEAHAHWPVSGWIREPRELLAWVGLDEPAEAAPPAPA